MFLIDSHCHLDQVTDLESYLFRSEAHGVKLHLAIGASRGLDSNYATLKIAESYSNVYCSIGFHPCETQMKNEFETLFKLFSHQKVIAIGETGLDKKCAEFKAQIELFEMHLSVAQVRNMPVIIHCRDAYREVLDVIKRYNLTNIIFHCFSGNTEELKKILSLDNSFVSYSGIVTFKKSDNVRFALRKTPLDRLLFETDAPYLAPEPYRNKKCESWMIVETVKKASEILDVNPVELAEITSNNFLRIFQLNVGS
ncbi:MAG: TatD family hydrolase [Deltaproteobacteria bacterium]|nr:TatD family hydrolase [Deltaproteobacteria bacterium]